MKLKVTENVKQAKKREGERKKVEGKKAAPLEYRGDVFAQAQADKPDHTQSHRPKERLGFQPKASRKDVEWGNQTIRLVYF